MAPCQLYRDSPHTPHPEPCHNCLRISCHSLHSYSASNCPYNICAECLALQALDAQITDVHNLLVDLSHKRRELKSKINRHHDPLTYYLPIEVISDIFTLTANANDEYQYYHEGLRYGCSYRHFQAWNPALRLGAVCKGWRDITLATPRLWTNVRIDVSSQTITDQWLSRSCSLPLSLDVHATKEGGPDLSHLSAAVAYSHTLDEIRSVSGRWKDLTLRLPMAMVHELFSTLEGDVALDSLTIQNLNVRYLQDLSPSVERDSMTILIPKRLCIYRVPLHQISVEWGSLAHLEATDIEADSLIHILRHAHHLDHCIVRHILESANNYPVSPVTNVSIKNLQVNINAESYNTGFLLEHLTLSSLQTLRCGVTDYGEGGQTLDVLINFLNRSQPPLLEFSLYYFSSSDYVHIERDWYRLFPSITHLHLRVTQDYEGGKIQGYIERLGTNVESLGLPSLRELNITAERINHQCWEGLATMFPENEETTDTASVNLRSLKTVTVHVLPSWSGHNVEVDIIPPTTHSRLRAIQKSGVTLKVFRSNGTDVLESDDAMQKPTHSPTDELWLE